VNGRGDASENVQATFDEELDARGWAVIEGLLTPAECDAVIALYDQDDEALFRKRVVMQRHGYGRGEYRYPRLAPVANRWNERLRSPVRFPPEHAELLARCHAAGQVKPTPLVLRYGAGDFNCLHQDLYGEHVFPLQATVLLSRPAEDFTGGEFVLTEQRPRMQSRPAVVPLEKGDAVIFAVQHRPVRGVRGDHKVTLRHGVSEIRSGSRHTLGIIFHDAG
jgi:hypothetical protein